MTSTREHIPDRVSDLFDGRPTRWMPGSRTIGDFDGHERTLEVFEANAREQLDLLFRLRDVRAELERAIGGPLVIVFHTSAETQRLYPEVRAERYRALAARIAEWMTQDSSDEPGFDPDDIARITIEAA
jgi:hypothetical protein